MTSPPDSPAQPLDPMLVRRDSLRRLARLGQRLGYLAFVASLVIFAAGLASGFSGRVAPRLVVLLVAGSVVLAPAIVLHYAVRAADDEDQGTDRRH
ncbi:MAG: hypothetical protein VX889_01270 [Actinomycetota bacterium]|nr:hypothetical protein [Actinomycetota bacterium]